jgi:hypothetical protein
MTCCGEHKMNLFLATTPENQNNGVNTELNKRLTKALEEMDLVQNKQWEVEKQKNELQETVSNLSHILQRHKGSWSYSLLLKLSSPLINCLFFIFKVDELEKDLKSEKESFRISRIKDEAILKDLRKELDASKQQCMELQVSWWWWFLVMMVASRDGGQWR